MEMLGMLFMHDASIPIHSMLCIYSTTANITIAYNVGAIGGVMLCIQIASGVLVAMTYVASDVDSFMALDGSQRDSSYG